MRVEQLTANGGKQSSGLRLTRIMRDVGDDGVRRTGHFPLDDARNVGHGECSVFTLVSQSTIQYLSVSELECPTWRAFNRVAVYSHVKRRQAAALEFAIEIKDSRL